jgi:hypothetical protein
MKSASCQHKKNGHTEFMKKFLILLPLLCSPLLMAADTTKPSTSAEALKIDKNNFIELLKMKKQLVKRAKECESFVVCRQMQSNFNDMSIYSARRYGETGDSIYQAYGRITSEISELAIDSLEKY